VNEHSRQLVVMRHAKAEPHGDSDAERELAPKGYADAVAAGRWLAERDFTPDAALVSSARRTTTTWVAVSEGGSFEAAVVYSDSLYLAGPETALDLVRETSYDVRSLIVVGHNPTAAYLAQLLDDGTGDAAAGNEMATGFPTSAMALFEITGTWHDLDLASARLVGFHVGRG
jgi:phosphohistidine phosphatase